VARRIVYTSEVQVAAPFLTTQGRRVPSSVPGSSAGGRRASRASKASGSSRSDRHSPC